MKEFFSVQQKILTNYKGHLDQQQAAVFGINPVELIAGNFPLRQKRLVETWAELHQEELQKDWERLQSGKLPEPIEPLH